MKTIKINGKLLPEERETILVYSGTDGKWRVDTTVTKHMNRFKKQDWTQTIEYVYEDGSVCGGVFEASDRGVSIRNPNKKRVMSEKQMQNLHKRDEEDEDDEE